MQVELFFTHLFNERQFNESFTTYVVASDDISISSTEIELQTGATPLIDNLALTLAEVTYINVVTSHTDNILLNVADVLVSIGLNVNDVSSIAITDTIITLENINNLDTTTITITEDSLAAYHPPVLVCDIEGEGIRWNWTKVA